MEFLLLEDRQLASSLPTSTADLLRDLGVLKKHNVERIYFCGTLVTNKKVFIFLPRNSLASIKNPAGIAPSLASALLMALHKYRSSSSIGSGETSDDEPSGLDILSDIVWLLNDYISQGIYSIKTRKQSLNHGNINWNRTIKKEPPFPGHTGMPVYLNLHTEKTIHNEQNPISLIHAEVIKALDHMFCWVITGNSEIKISSDIAYMPAITDSPEKKSAQLKKELASTYSDRETRLINCLINYIDNSSDGFSGEYLIGVRAFQGVWEEMLRATLPGVKPVNQLLPKPALYLRGSSGALQTKGMLTDIVSFVNLDASVIDAKYYRAEGIGDSPGWSDIVKQLFYVKAIQSLDLGLNIYNWFVFPGKHDEITGGPITAVGMVDRTNRRPLDQEFPPIGCAYFCPLEVIRKYTANAKFSVHEVAGLFTTPNIY